MHRSFITKIENLQPYQKQSKAKQKRKEKKRMLHFLFESDDSPYFVEQVYVYPKSDLFCLMRFHFGKITISEEYEMNN